VKVVLTFGIAAVMAAQTSAPDFVFSRNLAGHTRYVVGWPSVPTAGAWPPEAGTARSNFGRYRGRATVHADGSFAAYRVGGVQSRRRDGRGG